MSGSLSANAAGLIDRTQQAALNYAQAELVAATLDELVTLKQVGGVVGIAAWLELTRRRHEHELADFRDRLLAAELARKVAPCS